MTASANTSHDTQSFELHAGALRLALRPALSTIRPPRYDIGRRAAALLLAALEDGVPLTAQALPWELLPRGSTLSDQLSSDRT